jgi:anti-sigma regulatory factor (Ser/Thr protein kinase)
MPAFRHEALFYAGEDGFLAGTVPFLEEGAERGENALVAVSKARADALRAALGEAADFVRFVDMAELGRNPARIIPAWRDLVASREGMTGDPIRGVGEPIWSGRSETEVVECHRHESLLNLAFADRDAFWLVCPYDTEGLPPEVIEEARRTHPLVDEHGASHASDRYPGPELAPRPFDGELSAPGYPLDEFIFTVSDLSSVRAFVRRRSAAAGHDAERTADLVLAVSELAANSVTHGGGGGILRHWRDNRSTVWEVRDSGRFADPLLGREAPLASGINGRGLWLVNQVSDLVQMRSSVDGNVVRVHMTVAA